MDEDLDRQIEAVSENIEVVSSLEQQHDSLMQSRHELTSDGTLVSGDELAAQFFAQMVHVHVHRVAAHIQIKAVQAVVQLGQVQYPALGLQ